MKISTAIQTLEKIRKKFGDIEITGGSMSEDVPLSKICVTDASGVKIWPENNSGNPAEQAEVDGVFLT